MSLRFRQALIVALGIVAAAVMTWRGFWQLQVFTDQGNASVQARAEQPAVPLIDQVGADGTVGDIYGKPVIANGHYLAGRQQRVLDEQGVVRVLSAFQLADGRVLPVVRGVIAQGVDAPPAPAGHLTQTGLFLASEAGADHALARGYDLGSVRLAQLAQLWPEPLIPGFITLDSAEAARQGLQPAAVNLPTGEGSWRNSGYALQWWVFALFALGMTIKIAQGMGKRERTRQSSQ